MMAWKKRSVICRRFLWFSSKFSPCSSLERQTWGSSESRGQPHLLPVAVSPGGIHLEADVLRSGDDPSQQRLQELLQVRCPIDLGEKPGQRPSGRQQPLHTDR